MLTESNGRGEALEALESGAAPEHRLPSKGERRNRNTLRRADRSLASALKAEAGPGLAKGTSTLQTRLTFEVCSGTPRGDTDGPKEDPTSPKTTRRGTLEARVICEVYSANPRRGTEAKVTFSTLEPDPGSGTPRGDTDGPKPIAVVVKVHIPHQDAGQRVHVHDGMTLASPLMRSFGEPAAADQVAAPT